MTRITLNGVERGSLDSNMTYNYVEALKSLDSNPQIIVWTDQVLVVETYN